MREVELTVGGVHELELRGLGSAGYSWQTEVIGPEGVVAIERASSGSAPSAERGGPPPASGSIPEVLRISGLAGGRVRLHLELRRSWEQDTPPLDEEDVDVVVTA